MIIVFGCPLADVGVGVGYVSIAGSRVFHICMSYYVLLYLLAITCFLTLLAQIGACV